MSLKERLPEVLPIFRDSKIAVIIESIQSQITEFQSDTKSVQQSLFIESATGQSLDLIGDDFGEIGQRRGRDDTVYRQFLRGLVPIFQGRGTETDVEIAVAAGVAVDASEIDLREDFSNNQYEVELFDWTSHQTGTVHLLADLSDPVAVDRVDPLYYFSDPIAIAVGSDATRIDSGVTLPLTDVRVNADETESRTVNSDRSFGTARFDGTEQFS
jgi:hypothetical protein